MRKTAEKMWIGIIEWIRELLRRLSGWDRPGSAPCRA